MSHRCRIDGIRTCLRINRALLERLLLPVEAVGGGVSQEPRLRSLSRAVDLPTVAAKVGASPAQRGARATKAIKAKVHVDSSSLSVDYQLASSYITTTSNSSQQLLVWMLGRRMASRGGNGRRSWRITPRSLRYCQR